ncbi:hypothetical protein [Hymenobacter rubripertinctus]|uniref:DUF3575 domain-containing protein n=1 Tax=Hymenobacter rubripertinctus TaxID=2029981 RepID=A0A418R935_9BACT|nr:hypothetical protein [Hymenobacter rubripertinctus]RIY13801.1 hypothetical protein D0T11_01595 [Hymenobacter rubripertinctus]
MASPDLALTYERQLSARFSLAGGVGYWGDTFRSGSVTHNADDTFTYDNYAIRERTYGADAQLRYYLRRRQAHRPLSGWYGALQVYTYYQTARTRHTTFVAQNRDDHNQQTRAQLLFGRQWSFGSSLTLDTYIGRAFYREAFASNFNHYSPIGWGVQAGWRL